MRGAIHTKKLINDLAQNYNLDKATKDNLLNAELAEKSNVLHLDMKLERQQGGCFEYVKFMAINNGDKISVGLLFAHAKFKEKSVDSGAFFTQGLLLVLLLALIAVAALAEASRNKPTCGRTCE